MIWVTLGGNVLIRLGMVVSAEAVSETQRWHLLATLGPPDASYQQEAVRLMRASCVYAWLRDETVLYVGKGADWSRPVSRRHHRTRYMAPGDEILVWCATDDLHAMRLEAQLIRTLRPLLNDQAPEAMLQTVEDCDAELARLRQRLSELVRDQALVVEAIGLVTKHRAELPSETLRRREMPAPLIAAPGPSPEELALAQPEAMPVGVARHILERALGGIVTVIALERVLTIRRPDITVSREGVLRLLRDPDACRKLRSARRLAAKPQRPVAAR